MTGTGDVLIQDHVTFKKKLTIEGVYVTVVHPAFCLYLYLTGVHFRGDLQHGGDVSQQKIKCRPIITRELGGVSLLDVLYAMYKDIVFTKVEPEEPLRC